MSSAALMLTVERGPNAGERIPVKDTITVGRQADNTLTIADDSLSRHHARFEFQGNTLTVTDLGSANGTRVNGRPITGSQPLAPNDLVEFGGTALRVQAEGGATTQVADAPFFAATPPQYGASPPPAASFAPNPGPYAPQQPNAPGFAPAPGQYVPPPTPPRSKSSVPLILGIVGIVVVLCLCIGVGGIVLVSRAGGGGSAATPTTIPLFGGGGGTLPSTSPRPSTGGGGITSAGVARGDYLCQSFSAAGLATVGGLHIVSDTRVIYSPDDTPVSGAQQYTYRYDATTQSVTFTGGPYNGFTGAYDPSNRIIQVSPSVACVWQR